MLNTGIHAFDRTIRDLIKVQYELQSGLVKKIHSIIYFPRGNGKSVMYEFAVCVDRLNTVERILRVIQNRNKKIYEKMKSCVQGKCQYSDKTWFFVAQWVSDSWKEFNSSVASNDGNIMYFSSDNAEIALRKLHDSLYQLNRFCEELYRSCYHDRKFWYELTDLLHGFIPYG